MFMSVSVLLASAGPVLGQYWASLLLGGIGSGQEPPSLQETGMAWFAQFGTPRHKPRWHLAQA